mgnify:CR=1 FL=1
MIVIISGQPGTGKSTIAKLLAKKLKYDHKSSGDFQREIAKEKKITIKELAKLEEKDSALDKMVDDRQKEFGEKYDNFVMDTWLGAKFIPHAFKVFLSADEDTRAKRIFNDKENKQRRESENLDDFEKTKQNMNERDESNKQRWKKYYGFDYTERKYYDLVIDTSFMDVNEIVEVILKNIT